MSEQNKSLKEIANEIKAQGVCCNCDLDNWEPERDTGHSCVCRIHKQAKAIYGIQPLKGKICGN